ncbi:uncharacterized protein LOC128896626, partial [Hylaeus anthracinus]|uniref:uncharacterized protein LOC128896626 n=1 Tax=Hylaeus anthracinus TaxID=313031 RepID=UPI0023B95100
MSTNMNPLSCILDKNRLTGLNFNDWFRNLKIVLTMEKISHVLDESPPNKPNDDASETQKEAYNKWLEHDLRAKSYILASMNSELQKQHEFMMYARDIIESCKELFGESSRIVRFRISKELFGSRMSEGQDVGQYVLKMINLIYQLENLDFDMHFQLKTDLILQSLPSSFDAFITNYQMNKVECSLPELLNMLITYQNQKKGKGKEVAFVMGSSSKLKGKKNNNKKANTLKAKGGTSKNKKPLKKGKCHHCGKE